MRFTLTSLIRLISLLSLVLCTMAIGLSKAVPPTAKGHRKLVEPRYVGVNGSIFTPPVSHGFLLDRETGSLVPSKFAKSDHGLDYASVAPWLGDRGEMEIAGRCVSRFESGKDKNHVSLGVARYDYLSGKLMETAIVEPVVSGTPCWIPGASRKVIFPAGGDLYLQEFADEVEDAKAPRKISARDAFPGRNKVVFHDVLRPGLPEFRGRLLVSVSLADMVIKHESLRPSEIWAIQLDPQQTAIVSAEKLLDEPAPSGSERLPSVSKTPDGEIALAYLKREGNRGSWTLRLTSVRFESDKQVPRADAEGSVRVEGFCAVSRPEFSMDGRFVHRIRRLQSYSSYLDRIPVEDAIRGGSAQVASTDSR